MTKEEWIIKFYPVLAHEVEPEGAVLQSLTKWKGLVGYTKDTAPIRADASTCALCYHYEDDCTRCPLCKHLGAICGYTEEDAPEGAPLTSPWLAWYKNDNPQPMIDVLQELYDKQEGKLSYLPKDPYEAMAWADASPDKETRDVRKRQAFAVIYGAGPKTIESILNGGHMKFDTSYTGPDRSANHGKVWCDGDKKSLERMFHSGASLQHMCNFLGRSPAGVLPRLQNMGLIQRNLGDSYSRLDAHDNLTYDAYGNIEVKTNTATEKPIMNIETKTFIGGVDAANLSDTDIFNRIAKLEKDCKAWDAIEAKPKKLLECQAKLREDIAALVAYVDNRP